MVPYQGIRIVDLNHLKYFFLEKFKPTVIAFCTRMPIAGNLPSRKYDMWFYAFVQTKTIYNLYVKI